MSYTSDSLLTLLDYNPLTFTVGTPDSGEFLSTAAPKIQSNFDNLFGSGGLPPQRMAWYAKLNQVNALSTLNHSGTAISGGTSGVNGRGTYTDNMSKRVYRHYDTGTTANTSSGIRAGSSTDHGAIGSATGVGGFVFKHRIGFDTLPASSFRFFTGMLASGSDPSATADPSSYVNCFGLGKDSADTALQIMCNDGSGTCTKVALSSTDFPISARNMYEFTGACAPGTSGILSWRVRSITGLDADGNDTFGAVVATGQCTTNLPAADTALNAGLSVINNAANTSSFVMAFFSQSGVRL